MVTFEELPDLVQTRIYEFLLSADEVQLEPDESLRQRYAFSTPILRVNKSIHQEAARVFHNNHFTVVSTNSTLLVEALSKNRVYLSGTTHQASKLTICVFTSGLVLVGRRRSQRTVFSSSACTI